MPQVTLRSPIGTILLEEAQGRLVSLRILPSSDAAIDGDTPLLREAARQITAYFNGDLTRFDLPLASVDTPRGDAHRAAMIDIGYGETMSYGAIARMIGSSPRAVGQACRRNPFPIIVPCHRVVATGGQIGHYSGGDGVATKQWLINHENRR